MSIVTFVRKGMGLIWGLMNYTRWSHHTPVDSRYIQVRRERNPGLPCSSTRGSRTSRFCLVEKTSHLTSLTETRKCIASVNFYTIRFFLLTVFQGLRRVTNFRVSFPLYISFAIHFSLAFPTHSFRGCFLSG